MFTALAYFVVLLAACSCQTNTPTDPTKPANISGIFYRYYPQVVTEYIDVPLQTGEDLLNKPAFDKGHRTIIFVQSWEQNAYSLGPQAIVKAYLQCYQTNQVIFDWSSINTNANYASVAAQVKKVGTAFGEQLCELFAAGLDPDKTELIGFSLGVHVAGQAGSTVQTSCGSRIYRIVALDAVALLFYLPTPLYRPFHKDDGNQTIAIHTSGGQTGVLQAIANADFYPNEGTPIQPGCNLTSLLDYCNHIRSWQLFVESICSTNTLRAARGDFDFFLQSCSENAQDEVIYMGDNTDHSLQGKFYLTTNGQPTYGKGDQGLCA